MKSNERNANVLVFPLCRRVGHMPFTLAQTTSIYHLLINMIVWIKICVCLHVHVSPLHLRCVWCSGPLILTESTIWSLESVSLSRVSAPKASEDHAYSLHTSIACSFFTLSLIDPSGYSPN